MTWRNDDAKVRNPEVDLLLDTMWKQAFPQVSAAVIVPQGDPRQRFGIDRELLLSDGSTIPVEEKVRFRDYPGDILLEVEHTFEDGRKEPGWIRKPLACHYIGMLWFNSRTFRVYPWLALQAWYKHRVKDKTIRDYPRFTSKANNNGYSTVCVAVPERELPCILASHEGRKAK